jgi:hypothetical protein
MVKAAGAEYATYRGAWERYLRTRSNRTPR